MVEVAVHVLDDGPLEAFLRGPVLLLEGDEPRLAGLDDHDEGGVSDVVRMYDRDVHALTDVVKGQIGLRPGFGGDVDGIDCDGVSFQQGCGVVFVDKLVDDPDVGIRVDGEKASAYGFGLTVSDVLHGEVVAVEIGQLNIAVVYDGHLFETES